MMRLYGLMLQHLRPLPLALSLLALSPDITFAGKGAAPVPTTTIYPGDIVTETMLAEGPDVETVEGDYATARGMAVGRLARRTLLKGKLIPLAALDDPRAISSGASVQLVYQQVGISITASGLALQAARSGDSIRVRNTESGLVVTGVVSPDGIVKVSQ